MDRLALHGPTLTLRYAAPDDAPALLTLGADPLVTRFFSWGPYTDVAEPAAYIDALPGKRERGELLDFVVDVRATGIVGVTGLSELSRRDRRATVGSWFGQTSWGKGINLESKALIAHLGFVVCGLDRLSAWTNTRNGRSQRALERVGFVREGVLAGWHRHGDVVHDVVVFGMVRAAWERSALRDVPVTVDGAPPPLWVVS